MRCGFRADIDGLRFPGNQEGERVETDETAPISAYGRTKLEGEIRALEANVRTHVVRTAWLYGYKGKNFVRTVMRIARERGKISVVADQFGNPTLASDLVHEILKIAQSGSYGVWHCTNNGTCSWFDFALRGSGCCRYPLRERAAYQRRVQTALSAER